MKERDPQISTELERSGNPSEARTVLLDPDMLTQQAFISIGLECLRHIASNREAALRKESEGIHQMRIGLRRLRVALSIFKGMLRRRDASTIKAKLKWLSDQLAPARDYQVFLTEVFERSHRSGAEFEHLKTNVRAERDLRLNVVEQIVGSDRFQELVVEIALWLLDGAWLHDKNKRATAARNMPLRKFARHELHKRARAVSKAARRVAKLSPLRRHKLRIATKKMHYAYEFFERLIATKAIKGLEQNFISELASLQRSLGRLNDIAVEAKLASELSDKLKDDRKAYMLGFIVGLRTYRSRGLLRKATKSGRRLSKLT